MSSPSWPPPSIATDTIAIINECESMEMALETATQPHLAQVQVAALLYLGDYNHARHVWRRLDGENDSKWKLLTQSLTNMELDRVWILLQEIRQQSPAPLNVYAQEVEDAVRARLEDIQQGKVARPKLKGNTLGLVSFLETKRLNM